MIQVAKGDWQAVQQAPPWAVDAWGLGCLIQEVYSGQFLTRTEELRNVAPIPKTILPVGGVLLGHSLDPPPVRWT
jgi:SCY1-like protein 1